MVSYAQLSDFCLLTNRLIRRHYGKPDCCVFATGVNCEVLQYFELKAEPLRVETSIFPDDRKLYGCVLGGIGDGTRRPAAKRDMWYGHLVSLVEDNFLLDSTLDQANKGNRRLNVKPLVIDLRATQWFDPNPPWIGAPWTGLLTPWPGVQVRYTRFPRQTGWKNAGDFRPRRRRGIVETLIKLAKPIFAEKATHTESDPRLARYAEGDILVNPESPHWLQQQVYQRARRLQQEERYPLTPYSPDTSTHGLLLIENPHIIVGAASFCQIPHPTNGGLRWRLNFLWVDEAWRRKGLVTKRWGAWKKAYGAFILLPPISESMWMFVKRAGFPDPGQARIFFAGKTT